MAHTAAKDWDFCCDSTFSSDFPNWLHYSAIFRGAAGVRFPVGHSRWVLTVLVLSSEVPSIDFGVSCFFFVGNFVCSSRRVNDQPFASCRAVGATRKVTGVPLRLLCFCPAGLLLGAQQLAPAVRLAKVSQFVSSSLGCGQGKNVM